MVTIILSEDRTPPLEAISAEYDTKTIYFEYWSFLTQDTVYVSRPSIDTDESEDFARGFIYGMAPELLNMLENENEARYDRFVEDFYGG